MNALNVGSLLYISFRLAPFILVSYFTLSSLFNRDFKGIMYLAGLLLTSFVSVLIGNSLPEWFEVSSDSSNDIYENITKVCNLMTISKSGPLSNLPLSLVVFSYTFFYLLFPILKYTLVSQNVPTIIVFPIIIAADWIWQLTNGCATIYSIGASIFLGVGAGALWAYSIDTMKLTSLQYFNGISNKESCSVPSKQMFKCTVKTVTPPNKSDK